MTKVKLLNTEEAKLSRKDYLEAKKYCISKYGNIDNIPGVLEHILQMAQLGGYKKDEMIINNPSNSVKVFGNSWSMRVMFRDLKDLVDKGKISIRAINSEQFIIDNNINEDHFTDILYDTEIDDYNSIKDKIIKLYLTGNTAEADKLRNTLTPQQKSAITRKLIEIEKDQYLREYSKV